MFEMISKTLIENQGYKVLLAGLGTTLLIAFFAVLLGTVLGCILALMKISSKKPLKIIAHIYTTIIRGIPVVTQLMIFAFVVFGPMGITNKTLIAIIGFGINSGAYVCEIFRAGIEGI
ncbi:MAG: ABC transporter permease subunit, partial [Oscillospiraceae bacterium]